MVIEQYWHCPACGLSFETRQLAIDNALNGCECPACSEASMKEISRDEYLRREYDRIFRGSAKDKVAL